MKECKFNRDYIIEGEKVKYKCQKEIYCAGFCKQHYDLYTKQEFTTTKYKHSSKDKFYKSQPFSGGI